VHPQFSWNIKAVAGNKGAQRMIGKYSRPTEKIGSISVWLCVALLALLVQLPGCAERDVGSEEVVASNLADQLLHQEVDPNLVGQPLDESELTKLKQGLSIVHFGEYEAAFQAEKYKGRPIAADLAKLINDEKELFHNRISAIWLLGKTGDPSGQPVLKAIIDRPLPNKVSNEQYGLLDSSLKCLGMFADEASLDFLANEAVTEAYWLGKNPESVNKNEEPANFRRHMRLAALWGIAYSGSQRAIDLFESGEGIPEEFVSERESLLKAAHMRNLGYVRVEDYEARDK
jgi:hypothetical protein